MVVVAAKFAGKPERRVEILRLAASVAPPSRAEAGCITYNFYERLPSSNEFLFFEEWANQAALDLHFQTPHFLNFMKEFPDLIQGAPQIRVYEVGAMRDL
jgi:quinol monooxygenase YgiN